LIKTKKSLTKEEIAKIALLDGKKPTQADRSLMPRTTEEEWEEFRKTIPVLHGEPIAGVLYESVLRFPEDKNATEKDEDFQLEHSWEVHMHLEDWQRIAQVDLGLEVVDLNTNEEIYARVAGFCNELKEDVTTFSLSRHCAVRVVPMSAEETAAYLSEGKEFAFVPVKRRAILQKAA
jgi:hypothetical protein